MGDAPRRILVVDDDEEQILLIKGWYKNQSLTVLEARDGAQGLDVAAKERPDLILLDMSMPGLDGLSTVKRLKADPGLSSIPVIMLTAHRETDYKIRAFDAGGDDYVVKPFEFDELDARIRAMLRKRDLYLDLERKNRELADTNRHLEELSVIDEKTSLANFRHFRRKLHEEWLRAERYQNPLSLIMIDLDDFKRLNDTLGHTAGDQALREIATLVAGAARATDLAARFGGEEFVLLLPHTDSAMAARVAERILSAVRQHVFLAGEHPTSLTVSAGVATFHADDALRSAEELVKFADAAMYRAKGAGKNRVMIHGTAGDPTGKPLSH